MRNQIQLRIDEHHRRLICWDLYKRAGVASNAEVKRWVENRIDHDLQNLSDLKAEEDRNESV